MKPTTSLKLVNIILSLYLLLAYQAVTSESVVRNVITAAQFQHALNKAIPGDIIKLRSDEIFFEGHEFTASRSGEAGDPITITGSKPGGFASIILDATGSPSSSTGTTGLTISGDYWIIEGIEVLISRPYVGVQILGNNNTLSSFLITAYETGVFISGSGNTLTNSIINSTHGSGIYLVGDYNNITANIVEGSEWGLFLGNGTCCADFASNTVKGPVMVQGSNHVVRDNVISGDLLVPECNNNQFLNMIVKTSNPPIDSDTCSLLDNDIMYV